MAGQTAKKRVHDDRSRPKHGLPRKRQKRQREYHSDSDPDEAAAEADFQAVDLLDSGDEDIHNADVDDGMSSASQDQDSDSSHSEVSGPSNRSRRKTTSRGVGAPDASEQAEDLNSDSGGQSDSGSDSGADAVDAEGNALPGAKAKSKRNDPAAFATSLSKILSTKLSSTRRSDPVLSRSSAAREASHRVADSALEEKARKKLRQQKKAALEKGRVRDVLVASNALNPGLGGSEGGPDREAETTASILETERRLRKAAQRGVVKLFNAVRAAQVKAVAAEREARNEGLVGMGRREAKVAEMSRKGFLDLIASGGGGLKKGGLEEA